MRIEASELNAGIPGYSLPSQETSTGLITLNKIADAPVNPAPQGMAIKPPELFAGTQSNLVQRIAQKADAKKGGLKERAQSWTRKSPWLARLYRQPGLRKYAALDGSAVEAKKLIEEAKKNPALQRILKIKPPQMGRKPRPMHTLREAHSLMPSAQPAGPQTKTISLKQLPRLLPQAFRAASAIAKMTGMAPGLPMPMMARHRPLLAPGVA